MATNQNTGADRDKNLEAAKASYQVGKETLKTQGDYNNLLKDAQSILKKITTSYENLEAKLESLNRGSINTNKINQEILKAKQKDFILSKNLAESSKKINAEQNNAVKDYLDIQKQILEAEEDHRDLLESQAKDLFQNLNVEEQRYVQLKQANDLSKDSIKFAEGKLKSEKKINDSIGISARLMGILGKKLGANNDVYEDMVENARDLEKVGAKLTFFDKFKFLTKSVASSAWQSMKDPFIAIPAVGGAIAGVVGLLKTAFDFIVGIQDQTVKFARAMNLSTGEARKIKMEFASLSISSGNLFITSQKMAESQMELTDTLGVTNVLSKEILATNIELKDIAGLDAQTRASIAESATITGKSAKETTKAVLNQVIGLKQATGIGFQYQKILKEASNLSGVLGLQFAKYPDKLAKALVTTKAMGLELSKLDSMADSFLDFESSISKEFEAQLLTGKDINLAKAREAFLNNDLATAAAEITRQVGTAGEFLGMNRIKQEAIAAAMGMSRDDMANMLKQQELLSKLGAKDLKDAQAKVQALKAQGKTREEIAAITGEEAYQSLINASAQEKIAGFVDKIKQSFADFVESSGIIEKVEGIINWLSEPNNIRMVIETLRDWMASAVDAILQITNGVINAIDFVTFGFGIDEEFERKFEAFSDSAGNRIRSLGGDLSGIGVGGNAAAAAAGSGGSSYTTPASNTIAATGRERDLNIQIQVVDSATNISGRLNRGVYPESTTIV